MMQAIRVSTPLERSIFMSSPVTHIERRSSCGLSLVSKPLSSTVCQDDSSKYSASSSKSARRSLMIATMASLTGATAPGYITQPDSAEAAKRKPSPPTEEKDGDDKYLSAYDAKVLANIRRKEALKAQVEIQKAKAKAVRQPAQPPLDMFGQAPVPESQVPETPVPE